MINLHYLTLTVGSKTLLDNATTHFDSGQLTALIGRNGAGKSTLLRAVAGLNRRYSGKITIDSRDIASLNASEMARLLALVTTDRTRIPALKCRDVVSMGRAPYTDWIGRLQPADRQIITNSITAVSMTAFADRTMDTMSDGECQRIMIARALAQDTPVILLDEPTSFLDLPNRYELVSLLKTLAHDNGKCILFSTHELDIALKLCDNIALMTEQTIINLPVEQMIKSGHIDKSFNLTRL